MGSVAGTRPRIMFYASTPLGKMAKTLGCLVYEDLKVKRGEEGWVYSREFGDDNIKSYLFRKVCYLLPMFEGEYNRLRGDSRFPLTATMFFDRIHKQFYENKHEKGDRDCVSSEHYRNNKKLAPYVSHMREAVTVDRPLTWLGVCQIEDKIHPGTDMYPHSVPAEVWKKFRP